MIVDAKVDAAISALPRELNKRNIMEFTAATKRILRTDSGHKMRKDIKVLNDIRRRNITFMPSDKSRRLIALSDDRYMSMMDEHKLNLIPTKPSLPSSRQASFNRDLSRIANKYTDPLKTSLLEGLCCEPIPSRMRCLPKDHKTGELRGRPIVAAIDAPATKLSIILAKVLHPMIIRSVKSHLFSTSQFMDIVQAVQLEDSYQFVSFDVVNLYGSIPIEDSLFPGLISIVTDFFFDNKGVTVFSAISRVDFMKLLRLAVSSDTVDVNNPFFQQKSGIQMGSNVSVACATIFMNFIEKQILEEAGGAIKLWVRSIDDVFLCI